MGKALLFYFPGKTEPQAQKVFPTWLPKLGTANQMWGYWHKGPDEKAGAFCYFDPQDKDERPSLDPNPNHQWTALPKHAEFGREAGELFIGIEGEVTPTAVARKKQLRGHFVPFADGNDWLIPAVQQLPHKFSLGENGEAVREIDAKYAAWGEKAIANMRQIFLALDMWDLAKDAIKAPETEDSLDVETTIELKDSIDFICESIALNYILNKELVLALNLLDDMANQRAISATFDMPAIMEFCNDPQKKTEELVTIPAS